MHLMRFPRLLRCLGNYFADGFLGSGWGFVIRGSYFLCSFLCNSLGLGPCFYLCSLGPGCCSSNEGHSMSCTVGRFVPGGEDCSTEGVAAEGRKLRSFCFLRIHFGVVLLSGH